ncbi:hypothetical protein EBO15_17345, partial [Actinomadura harenae]
LARTPVESATAGEGARFWAAVMADLRNRGVRDILIACTDAPRPAATSRPTTPWSNYCGWPSSTSRTNGPGNEPPSERKATNTPSNPPGSSRDNAPQDGEKHSTNSPSPIQDASGKPDLAVYLHEHSTPEVTGSTAAGPGGPCAASHKVAAVTHSSRLWCHGQAGRAVIRCPVSGSGVAAGAEVELACYAQGEFDRRSLVSSARSD